MPGLTTKRCCASVLLFLAVLAALAISVSCGLSGCMACLVSHVFLAKSISLSSNSNRQVYSNYRRVCWAVCCSLWHTRLLTQRMSWTHVSSSLLAMLAIISAILFLAFRKKLNFEKAFPPCFLVLHFGSLFAIFANEIFTPWKRGIATASFSLVVHAFAMLLATSPGVIPNTPEFTTRLRPRLLTDPNDQGNIPNLKKRPMVEAKKHGGERVCKWCSMHKPDRCHQCKICGTCVLKMDHHCPWVMNCIGFRTHRMFLCIYTYAAVCFAIALSSLGEAYGIIVGQHAQFMDRLVIGWAMSCVVFDGMLIITFFLKHLWLCACGLTTIEFHEKRGQSIYNLGRLANFLDACGRNPLCWLFPAFPPRNDDGLAFAVRKLTVTVRGAFSGAVLWGPAHIDGAVTAAALAEQVARTVGGDFAEMRLLCGTQELEPLRPLAAIDFTGELELSMARVKCSRHH